MKLEDQVVSLELAKKLKELGVKQSSLFRWGLHHCENGDAWILHCPQFEGHEGDKYVHEAIPAFTVAELGELLGIHRGEYGRPQLAEETEADYRAMALIFSIADGLVKP